MTKYTLTKNYSEIAETYGVMQNLSSDAILDEYGDLFLHEPKHCHKTSPLAVRELPHHYLVRLTK